jgi:hypothetical protein
VSNRIGVRSGRSTQVNLSNTAIGDFATITPALQQWPDHHRVGTTMMKLCRQVDMYGLMVDQISAVSPRR